MPAYGLSSERGNGLVLCPEGEAIVLCSVSEAPGDPSIAVVKVDIQGEPNKNFGRNGWSILDVRSNDNMNSVNLGLQTDGQIIVAGSSYTFPQTKMIDSAFIARFKPDGTLDKGSSGFADQYKGFALTLFGPSRTFFSGLDIQEDQRFIVAGSFVDADGNSPLLVARYNANGTLDTTFNVSLWR